MYKDIPTNRKPRNFSLNQLAVIRAATNIIWRDYKFLPQVIGDYALGEIQGDEFIEANFGVAVNDLVQSHLYWSGWPR